MTIPCSRSWEVEAARDGRLTGVASESFGAHLSVCHSCKQVVDGLDSLARDLRTVDSANVDELSLRRLRSRVLEAVDAEQTGRVRIRAGRRGLRSRYAALALAAAGMGLVVFFSSRAPQQVAPTFVASQSAPPIVETRVEVSAAEGARFTRTIDGDEERFALLEGTLRLRVVRAAGGRRVLVTVPDGEIEDVGTVFDVAVRDGHTERVAVDEGRVLVRIAGTAPMTIGAGGSWDRVMVAELQTPNADAGAATSAAVSVGGGAAAPVRAPSHQSSAASASPLADREDAAYLDVLRLLQAGREDEARAAANTYLREFPAGFRRKEMTRIVRDH